MENLLLGNVIESGNISPFSCPFCGYNGSLDLMGADRFPVLRTLQVIGAGRRAARCPKCKSSDKERLVYIYLKEVEKIEKTKGLSILHIAPESNLQIWLQSISDKYIAGDAFLQNQKFIGKVLGMYLQLIIPQYFISNKSGIWSLSLIVHSKG